MASLRSATKPAFAGCRDSSAIAYTVRAESRESAQGRRAGRRREARDERAERQRPAGRASWPTVVQARF